MGKTWSRGTNSSLPFGVNVNLNLPIIKSDFLPRGTAAIYPYPISSIPVQKLDIALHSEFLENIIE